jgi:hypothetical protein
LAHLLLTRGHSEDEKQSGIDEAARLLKRLRASSLRDDALEMIDAARAGDPVARRSLADSLDLLRAQLERART